MRIDLYQPPGYETPERCHCGHYVYVHQLDRCGRWAHSGHTLWGRIGFRLSRWQVNILFRCPCRLGREEERDE